MSDFEKALAKAKALGPTIPLQLRWEGAGNAAHAAQLLSSLQAAVYNNTDGAINYHAVINLYEKKGSAIANEAMENLENAHINAWGEQSYEIAFDVNVTRKSKALTQHAAHIMFIRNIMPTNTKGASLTNDSKVLNEIHTGAVRERANSLQGGGGMMRIGMSGEPGLNAATNKFETKAKSLFKDFDALADEARNKALKMIGTAETPGGEDFDDSVDVMKNDGKPITDLKGNTKKTYYLTFQN